MKYYLLGSCLVLTLLLSGCATYTSVDTTNLASIESLTVDNAPVSDADYVANIRYQAIQETATSFGAQAGLSWQANNIDQNLTKQAALLDQTYNFNALMLDNNVLPPVLEQGDQLLNLADSQSIRIADKTYKIVSQARFVTTPPNWREYIWMNYPKPEVPDRTLLPKNAQEQQVWVKYIHLGWKQGITQANTIYADNLARLQRDFQGMILYKELLAKNMVSKPFVASSNLGVTANDDDSQLYINDKVLRITALPKLDPNSKNWRAVITP